MLLTYKAAAQSDGLEVSPFIPILEQGYHQDHNYLLDLLAIPRTTLLYCT